MKVRLTVGEFNYLTRSEIFPLPMREIILKSATHYPTCYILNVSDDFAVEIRELCSENIGVVGFDKNYELTEEGKTVESLIDKFFIG